MRRGSAVGALVAVIAACAACAASAGVAHAAPPANDAFPGVGLTGPSATGTILEATGQPGEPNHAGTAATAPGGVLQSVWYMLSAPQAGTFTLTTCNAATNYDTVLAVYRGAAVGSLTAVATGDDDAGCAVSVQRSTVTFAAQAGDAFRIAVDGFEGAQGAFRLDVGFTPAATPPPDADGDGVPNGSDACPTVAAATADGCPAPAGGGPSGGGSGTGSGSGPAVGPGPAGGPGTGGGTAGGDRSPPKARLTGKSTQKLASSIAIGIACPDEACKTTTNGTVRVPRVGAVKARTYRLTAVKRDVALGGTATVRTRLGQSTRAALARALKAKKRLVVNLTVLVEDAVGNGDTVRRSVTLSR